MDAIKKFIACAVPTNACNFRCSYCYLTCHENAYNGKIYDFPVPVEMMIKALSKERLGGTCYFNMCAAGETTLQKDLFPLIKGLIDEGHYCDIITNGSITKKFDELIALLSEEESKHLFIKFSFHYLQLKEKNLLQTFVNNVNKIKDAKISFTIEITPHDELIPYIDEIKEFSIKNFKALPHITVARNESTNEIELLTKLTREEYKKTWEVFDSPFFDFKFSVFNKKITEFCYAGQNSLYLDLHTGEYKSCYCGDFLGNMFDHIEKPINFAPIGKCNLAHCFNAHAFIAWAGNVPDLSLPIPTYAEERNRICLDGTEWLQPECKAFFETRADKLNPIFTEKEKKQAIKNNNRLRYYRLLCEKIRGFKRHLGNK
ncbi:MAG: hypothetical protein IJJ70_07900 [Treponema sp.]|nr:hypothetical protein [Treponema sp.]